MTGSRVEATLLLYPRFRFGLAAALLALAAALAPAPVLADEPPTSVSQPEQVGRVEAVIAAARAYLGTPYRVGTEGPATIDCSGLVFRAFANSGELRQIGGARLRAAGYLRWFAGRDLLTTDAEQAERGDLVMYANGKHIGLYLGDGRVISALVTGVTVHTLDGITVPVTGFLAVDWTGKRGPFKPGSVVPPAATDEPEVPAALVPAASWTPAPPTAAVAAGPRLSTRAQRVERIDMRTSNSRTFQEADGRFTTEVFARPIHYLPSDATRWVPIDLHFRAPRNGEKFAGRADATPVTLTLRAAESSAPLLRAAGAGLSVGLTPSGIAGDAVPELAAEAGYADYRDALDPEIGMRVLPRADGFKAFLVFADKPEARSFGFELAAQGVAPALEADGSLVLRDAAGVVVGRFARPMLLDSSDVEGEGGGVRADAAAFRLEEGEVEGNHRLVVTIERAALDEAVYPAYVDLGLVDFPSAALAAGHTFVSSTHPNGNFSTFQRPESGYAELWHGRRPDRRDDNEAYLRFPGAAELLRGTTIESASLAAFPYWQDGSDAPAQTWLGRVATDWDLRTVTWKTRPEAVLDGVSHATQQGEWTQIDVSTYVRDIAAGAADFGLVLHADGAGRGHWKRFVAESGLGEGALEPRLVVTWSDLRPTITSTTNDGTSIDVAWANATLAPTANRVQIQVSSDGFATTAMQLKLKGNAAAAGVSSLPADALEPGTYSWRVRAKYGDAAWSGWSEVGTFVVGAVAPRGEALHQGSALRF